MEKLPSAVVAGHICLDIIPGMRSLPPGGFKELFQPGHLLEVGAAALSTGGPVSNTGLALHRLGIPTRLICKIGSDAFGRIIRDLIVSFGPGLADGIVEDPQIATSYSMILSPPDLDRIVLHNPAANDTFSEKDINYSLVAQAALFHFGYPPVMRRMYADGGRSLVELFRRVKQTGVTTSLDMCYPDPDSEGGKADWRAILNTVLPFVDIFQPSIEELLMMMEREMFEDFSARGRILDQITPALLHALSDELLGIGVPILVFKLGEKGFYLRTASRQALMGLGKAAPANVDAWAGRELWAPCFQVRVAGTTGAGDTSIAGFLSAFLRGLAPEQAVTAAVAVGACNVEAPDALSGLRGWQETLDRIRAGWERLPLLLKDPFWAWDASAHLWSRNG